MWCPLATSCVPTSTARDDAWKRSSASRSAPGREVTSASSLISSSSGSCRASSASRRCVPAPICATSAEPQAGHAVGAGSVRPQWWQCRRPSRCSVSATSHEPHLHERPQARQCSAGATPRRLSRRMARPRSSADAIQLGEERRRQRVPGLAAQVDEPHGRERGSDPRRQRKPLEALPALGARRGAAVHGDRALQRRALRRNGPRVVPRVGVLLVRGVLLLVDDDQARDRGAARTARSAHRPRPGLRRSRRGRARRDAPHPRATSARTATVSPKRCRKRPTVCGASAISGTSTIAPRPRSSAAAHACRYTSVLPLPVGPASRRCSPSPSSSAATMRSMAATLLRVSAMRAAALRQGPRAPRATDVRSGARVAAAPRARAPVPEWSRSSRRARGPGRRAFPVSRRGRPRREPAPRPAAPRPRPRSRLLACATAPAGRPPPPPCPPPRAPRR